MKTTLLLAILFLSISVPSLAWAPVECGPEHAKAWQEHARAVRHAEPGSPLYTPQPYPQTDDQVIEDFSYPYREIWRDDDFSQHPPEAKTIYDGLESGSLTFQVSRVETWSIMRCGPEKRRAFYYLIRIFDRSSREELGRAAVNEDGLLAEWNFRPSEKGPGVVDEWRSVIPTPDAVMKSASQRLGLHGNSPQLVTTSGQIYCSVLEPCVAFRGPGAILLVKEGRVFRIRDDGPRFSIDKMSRPEARNEVLSTLRQGGERLVSIGGAFALAETVPEN